LISCIYHNVLEVDILYAIESIVWLDADDGPEMGIGQRVAASKLFGVDAGNMRRPR
jgi:hypothetical protein